MNWPLHGANPHRFYETTGLPLPERVLDFSVNTNPYTLPLALWPTQADFCRWASEYPDSEAEELIRALAQTEQLSEQHIFVGNGASQCIDLLARLFSGKRVGIVEPTFSEYRRSCLANGCPVQSLVSTEESSWRHELSALLDLLEQVDVLFLCQPNNPTGTAMEKESLYTLVQAADERRKFVVIDEAFYHFWDGGYTTLPWISSFPHLIVVRSLTKIYHLAGARVGYVAANETIVEKLKALQPAWSVSQLAQQLALHFLPMREFVRHTRSMIASERQRVTSILREAGYYVSPSVANFYLLRPLNKPVEPLLYGLLKEGIVPRHTLNFQGLNGRYLRLAVKTTEENDQLVSSLTRWQTW
ncbi:threonine-phosphate decarboxylase CobD [Anoxybacteroides amylolyticum]|uniref:threonine-phosphate decarboxylase n=1 Tax=Anoxybacteroides amylolyticum TaxID=294699 RepID=A0A160F246_9BACL|nr:threonine-phosphate decarboxylase CobD [Anoxybacillus amylolyticus]ANB60287.1 threonine-phosphate decarboxylase [Anoxybacillus amylolyticus]